ncbi:MAG TPA: hypothetical protein VGB85_20975 [Nannocystis sp.]|jgi:hypothetical protein
MSPSLRLFAGLLAVSLVGCAGGGTPPTATPGAAYVVKRETPFYDSGCAQDRKTDGKLKKGTRFTLVSEREGCWNIKLAGEDEVYIVPDRVAPAG